MGDEVLLMCSNIVMAFSYFALTYQLVKFANSAQVCGLFATLRESNQLKKKNLVKMLVVVSSLFGASIALCGCTHALSAVRYYFPHKVAVQTAQSVVLVFCSAVSFVTVIGAWRLFPSIGEVFSKFELNAEGNLQLTENYLIEIVEMVKEGILVISESLCVTRCNEAAKALFCSPTLLGENLTDYIHPQDLNLFHETVNRVLSSYSLTPVTIEYRIRQSSLLSSVSASSHSTNTNLSVKRSSPKHNSRSSSRIYTTDEPTEEMSPNSSPPKRLPTNRSFSRLSSRLFSVKELVEDDTTAPKPPPILSQRSSSSTAEPSFAFSPQNADPYIWVESTICKGMRMNRFEDLEYDLKIVSRNIDDKKRESLIHFQNILKENEERGRVNAAKMRYLSCIAHDLKTPLQSFCFTLDLLTQSSLHTEQRDFVQQANVAVDLMKLTISQTMDISKALTGAKLMPRRTTVFLSSVLHRVQIIINGYGKQVPVSFEVAQDVNDAIITDEEWLWQMLLNLLTNACKYTDKGEIRVMLSHAPAALAALAVSSSSASFLPNLIAQDMLKVEVFDTGIGIGPDKIDHVFDAFAQVQDGQVTGTGLGLYGVRMRAEGLQGTCGARHNTESSTGTGTVLWFAIPYVPDDSEASVTVPSIVARSHSNASLSSMDGIQLTRAEGSPPSVLSSDKSSAAPSIHSSTRTRASRVTSSMDMTVRAEQLIRSRKLTACVIDDTLTVRKLMEKLLLRMGFDKVQCYENGSKGLDAMMAEPVDIVFSDVQMPIMTGPEMIRRFRKFETDALHAGIRAARQLVIAVTANGTEINNDAETGFDDICPKPLGVTDIYLLINKHFY